MKLSLKKLTGFFFLCLLFVTPTKGQEQEAVRFQKVQDEIIFDGKTNDVAWQNIEPFPMTVYRPEYRGEPSRQTEVRVAYNKTHLYVAAQMHESNPENIRTNTLFRDQYSGDDLLAVILDTYDDNENALFFHINPAGTRVDIALSNDAEGDFLNVANFDWNTFWDAKTIRTKYGWSAEMRIPFTSLGFQVEDDKIIMGLIIYRYMAYNNEVQVYPDISPQFNFYKPSKAKKVLLRDVEDKNPIYFTPYLFGELEQSPKLNQFDDTYKMIDDFSGDVGFDLKYNLSNFMTLDVTVNTDFAQVEADDQQINLSRFSLFFPEKRQFFQERAGIFDYKLGFEELLFHSRRIGLSENGEPIPIIGGLRLVGRTNGWDVGLLNMQTARFKETPSENFGVARLRRQVFNPYSYAGGIFTSRYDEDGNYNISYGLDGIFRVTDNEYFSLQWSQTADSEVNRVGFFETALTRLRWERRKQQGFYYFTDITWSGSEYRPELGFFVRRNVAKFMGNFGYGWLQEKESSIRMATPSLPWLLTVRNEDGSIETSFVRHEWNLEWKSGATLTTGLEANYENLRSSLQFPENTTVSAGSYDFYRVDLFYTMALSNLFRVNAGIGGGTFYGGRKIDFSFEPIWNISKYLELNGMYLFNDVQFSGNQSFHTHIGRFRAKLAFNNKAFLYSFIQYNSAASLISANMRFRYNFREGNDLWIVYNEGLNTHRNRAVPALPISGGRSFQIKYTYTFIW